MNGIRAIFCDFYGTLVFEDGEIIGATARRILQSGHADGIEEICAFWWERFSALFTGSYGAGFRTQRDLELQALRETVERFGAAHGIPTVYTDDFGHGTRHAILPIGIRAVLDADNQSLTFCE